MNDGCERVEKGDDDVRRVLSGGKKRRNQRKRVMKRLVVAQAMFDWPGLSVLWVWVVLVLALVVAVVVVVVLLGLALGLSLELPLAPAAPPTAAPVASDWSPPPLPPPPPPPPPPGLSVDDCMYLGISMGFSTGWIRSSCSVKLKSGGSSRPLGSRVPCSRSSWKNECAHACSGVIRRDGVYSSNRATKSIASGGVRALNTCKSESHIVHILPAPSSFFTSSVFVCSFRSSMSLDNLFLFLFVAFFSRKPSISFFICFWFVKQL